MDRWSKLINDKIIKIETINFEQIDISLTATAITVACILIDKLKLSRWPVVGKVRRELGFYCYLYSLTHSLTQTDSIAAYAFLGSKLQKCKCKFNVKHRECLRDHPSQRLMIKCLTIIQIELEFGSVSFWGEGKSTAPSLLPCMKNILNLHIFTVTIENVRRQSIWTVESQSKNV